MSKRFKKHNHLMSLRLSDELAKWIDEFAAKWDVSASYVCRSALRDFVNRQQQVAR